jgi:hypothetical protein
MAASRWKRFAFFDRNTLTFPGEVVQDLVPGIDTTISGRRVPSLTLDEGDTVSMVVSTAALPLMSRPTEKVATTKSSSDAEKSLMAMWGTLNACTAPPLEGGNVKLPSQAQIMEGNLASSVTSQASLDGLVLVFLASQESDRVHCIDVTVRCNPPNNAAAVPEDDSLDGWRGYWTPFFNEKPATASSRMEDRIISDHMTAGSVDRIVDLATCRQANGKLWVACISNGNLIVHEDPHLGLSCRIPLSTTATDTVSYKLAVPWNGTNQGQAQCVDMTPGLVAVGTDVGSVHIYIAQKGVLRAALTIPSPSHNQQVTSLRLSVSSTKVSLFVCYHHRNARNSKPGGPARSGSRGICCYDLGAPNSPTLSAPQARHDLDSRPIISSRLCDAVPVGEQPQFLVARADGLYTYSQTQKIGVSPIDGIKLAVCNVPSHTKSTKNDSVIGASYALVASTDAKSGRDAVDIYDATNKLVAFHVLLSPSHKALQAAGLSTPTTKAADGSLCGGRSSAIILTVRVRNHLFF